MSRRQDTLLDSLPGAFPQEDDAGDGAAGDDAEEESDERRTQRTLWQAVRARRHEYTEPRTVRIKVGSWNVAALKGTEDDLPAWFGARRRRAAAAAAKAPIASTSSAAATAAAVAAGGRKHALPLHQQQQQQQQQQQLEDASAGNSAGYPSVKKGHAEDGVKPHDASDEDAGSGLDEGEAGEGGEAKAAHESPSARRASAGETTKTQEEGKGQGKDDEREDEDEEEEDIGLYVLGLQEIVDVTSPAETLRLYTDPAPAQKWRRALLAALPPGCRIVAQQQLVGLLLLVAAAPALAPLVSGVSTASVGTGFMGYMGNKGGVAARLVLGEATRAVFVNCHLAAGADRASCERRNWDAAQIAQRARFEPLRDNEAFAATATTTTTTTAGGTGTGNADTSGGNGAAAGASAEGIGDADYAWWFGDLNYRMDDLAGEDVRRLLARHLRNEHGVGEPLSPEDAQSGERSGLQAQDLAGGNDGGGSSSSGGGGEDAVSARERAHEHKHEPCNVPRSRIGPQPEPKVSSPSPSASPPSSSAEGEEACADTLDPASLAATLASLLPHDQLRRQQAARKALHEGWREGPITFLPTYKYDVGSVSVFDSSEKRRSPSWCDRILFRSQQDLAEHHRRSSAERERSDSSGKRTSASSLSEKTVGIKQGEHGRFDYDPEVDGDEDAHEASGKVNSSGSETIAASAEHGIHLSAYTSHQRIHSSDHKPLVAVFTVQYTAAVPELKKKVYEEVAREFDRVENERRPGLTIVIERGNDDGNSSTTNEADGLTFENVRFKEEQYCGITVANTSRVSARFAFVSASDSSKVLPRWLSYACDGPGRAESSSTIAQSSEMALAPGDALHIRFRLCVDDASFARMLNNGREKLEDVLVLRIFGGRDHFIPVQGGWIKSKLPQSA